MRTSRLIATSGWLSLITLVIGAATSYAARPFELETFHISSLQDDFTNPQGYLVPLVGTFIGQLLLMIVAVRFGRRLGGTHPAIAYTAAILLVASLTLLSVNSVHEFLGIQNWHVHAILAHLAFGLMILAHLGFIVLARGATITPRYDLGIDRGLVLFSLLVVVALFLIPKFTGVDVFHLVFGVNVDLILGICEVAYLTIFYVSLWRVARNLE